MDIKIILAAVCTCLAIGFIGGRYTAKPSTVTKLQEVRTVQHDVQVVTHEIVRPDGTKDTTTISTDKSHEDSSIVSEVVVVNKPQWNVSSQFVPNNPNIGYFYGVTVSRRIIGPIYAGAFVNTDKQVGLSVGVEF